MQNLKNKLLINRKLRNVLRLLAGAFLFLCVSITAEADGVIINSADVFRPIKNTIEGAQSGQAIVYDDPANPTGVFHGVFEIKFGLNRDRFAENVKVHVFVKKGPDANPWLKIAEIAPSAKPATGDWITKFYWNSRAKAFDWTDTTPFKMNLKIKFKVIE